MYRLPYIIYQVFVENTLVERRTGRFIKEELLSGPASISDLHQRYRQGIVEVLNEGRDRSTRIRPPTYSSFYQYFRHFITLGLVERVGEAPTEDIDQPEKMGFVESVDGQLQVHEGAVKRLWRLTPEGESETEAWEDPMRALGYYPRP